MKNKMQFMLPKIIGITIIAGVVTFIAATIFKLLLAGTVLIGTVALIRKFAGKKRKQLSQKEGNQNFFEMKNSNFKNPFQNKMASVSDAAIYPIN
jgi:hypothetical protein